MRKLPQGPDREEMAVLHWSQPRCQQGCRNGSLAWRGGGENQHQ